MQRLIEHTGRDDGTATFGDAKTPRTVCIVIHTNFSTLRNDTAPVYDGVYYCATIQNFALGQDKGIDDT